MKKLLWFSRHQMTEAQKAPLAGFSITQINANYTTLEEFRKTSEPFDVLAVVLPTKAEAEVLSLGKPVIKAETIREVLPSGKTSFKFNGWTRITRIQYDSEPFKASEIEGELFEVWGMQDYETGELCWPYGKISRQKIGEIIRRERNSGGGFGAVTTSRMVSNGPMPSYPSRLVDVFNDDGTDKQ